MRWLVILLWQAPAFCEHSYEKTVWNLQILTILSRGKIQTQDTECQLKPTIQRYIICSVMPLYALFSDHWSSEHKLHEFVRITILAISFLMMVIDCLLHHKYEKLERADCANCNSKRLVYLAVEITLTFFLEVLATVTMQISVRIAPLGQVKRTTPEIISTCPGPNELLYPKYWSDFQCRSLHLFWIPDPTHEEGSGEKPCPEVSWVLECHCQCWWGNEHHFSQPVFKFD